MGFEVYVQCLGERPGIPRDGVRELFPIAAGSEVDRWRISYDERNTCTIGVTAAASAPETLTALYVDRPCNEPLLWEGLLEVLRRAPAVMFWPGGPPILADESHIAMLPEDMVAALGPPRVVHSVVEIRQLLQDS